MLRPVLICLLLAAVTLGIYWPVGQMGFSSYDDPDYIITNQAILSEITPESIVWAFTSYNVGTWQPVTCLSYMMDCQLFGLHPGAFHLVNLAFHIANTLLLFLLLRKMTRAVWRSALVAALFAWHPLHIQSVAWIAERKDVLSGFFMLLTLWAYALYVEQTRLQGPRSDFFKKLSLALFALGLMSKSMLVTLPVLLLLLDFWPLRRFTMDDLRFTIWRRLGVEKIPFFALSLLAVMTTLWSQGGSKYIIDTAQLSLMERLANVPAYVLAYLEKLFWPVDLAVFYPYQHIPAWNQAAALLLVILITGLGLWRLRAQPYLMVGWLWFLIMLLPVIGLVKVGAHSIADRYTYLPASGIFVMVAWGLNEITAGSGRWRIAGLAIGVTALLVGCLLDTRFQLKFWQDNITMFQRSVDVTKENNVGGYFGLANAQWHEAGDLDKAVASYQSALHCSQSGQPLIGKSEIFGIRHNLGAVLLLQDKPVEAETQFRMALTLKTTSDTAFTHKYLGDALLFQGKPAEAGAEYDRAVQLLPENSRLLSLVSDSKTLAGLLETLKTQPTPEIHVQIAQILASQEQFQAAADHYAAALKLQPDSPEILNNLAWLLATCPNQKVRNGNLAVQSALQACKLTRFSQTFYVGTLAAAYAAAGQFDDAIRTARKACALAASYGEMDLLKKNRELLKHFYLPHKAVRG